MTERTALDALRKLGERASKRPWQESLRYILQAQSYEILAPSPNILGEIAVANAAYATVAVNSIDAAVAALESAKAYMGSLPYSGEISNLARVNEVLDAIRKAAQEAK